MTGAECDLRKEQQRERREESREKREERREKREERSEKRDKHLLCPPWALGALTLRGLGSTTTRPRALPEI